MLAPELRRDATACRNHAPLIKFDLTVPLSRSDFNVSDTLIIRTTSDSFQGSWIEMKIEALLYLELGEVLWNMAIQGQEVCSVKKQMITCRLSIHSSLFLGEFNCINSFKIADIYGFLVLEIAR